MPIEVRCPHCNTRFRAKDHLAGQTVNCLKCQSPLQLPAVEAQDTGETYYYHEARERPFEPVVGGGESIEQITEHVERYLGPVSMVFHEIVSDLVHLDVHWIQPTPQRGFHTLFTTGMSDLPMTVPPGAEEFRYAETLICLPPEWPIGEQAFEDENNYWPVRWLKTLARMPHEYETWLGVGHTVPNGDPPEPLADNTRFCCALMLPPVLADEGFDELQLDDEKTVHFLALVPLYREEMEFKLKHGVEELLERFEEHGVSELLDIHRKNVCRRRLWPF